MVSMKATCFSFFPKAVCIVIALIRLSNIPAQQVCVYYASLVMSLSGVNGHRQAVPQQMGPVEVTYSTQTPSGNRKCISRTYYLGNHVHSAPWPLAQSAVCPYSHTTLTNTTDLLCIMHWVPAPRSQLTAM